MSAPTRDELRHAVTLRDGTKSCPRCSGDHEPMEFRRMAIPFAPIEAGGLAWTHWATCPTTGDPILLCILP